MMPFLSGRRVRWMLFSGWILAACSGGVVHFTAAQDAALMTELETVFSEVTAGSLKLSLCEDRARSDAWQEPGGCQEAHVVRGGGRGLEHQEDEPSNIGCGGCPFDVRAYVQGVLEGGEFAEPVALEGTVHLGDLHDPGEVFAYPYALDLRCKEASCTLLVSGQLHDNGRLELEIRQGWSDSSPVRARLQAGPAAVCGL